MQAKRNYDQVVVLVHLGKSFVWKRHCQFFPSKFKNIFPGSKCKRLYGDIVTAEQS